MQFATQDQPSGIAFYAVSVDGNTVGTTTNTSFTLPSLSFGSHPVVVQAVDYAGNITESRLSVTIEQPPMMMIGQMRISENQLYGTIILLIVVFTLAGILAGWWIGRKEKMQRKDRVIITERDVMAGLTSIQKVTDKLIALCNDVDIGMRMDEIKFSAGKIKEEVDKLKQYGVKEVEEIE